MILGKIENMEPGDRDAVHAAIIWANADKPIGPCLPVRFLDFDEGRCVQCAWDEKHGITDPFGMTSYSFAVILDPELLEGPMFHNFDVKGSKNERRGSGYSQGYSDGSEYDECKGCY